MSRKIFDNAIYFKISSDLKKELGDFASKNETTVGQIIRQAIKSYIRLERKAPKKKQSA